MSIDRDAARLERELSVLGKMSDADIKIVRDYVARNQFPRKTTTKQLLAHIDSLTAERDALQRALRELVQGLDALGGSL